MFGKGEVGDGARVVLKSASLKHHRQAIGVQFQLVTRSVKRGFAVIEIVAIGAVFLPARRGVVFLMAVNLRFCNPHLALRAHRQGGFGNQCRILEKGGQVLDFSGRSGRI